MGDFNPYLIALAREYRSIPQKDLCQRIGMVQGSLSKIENGQMTPSDQQVADIASALGFPPHFFFQELRFHNLPQVFFRKYNTSQSTVKLVHALVSILREQARKLLTSVQMEDDKVPRVSVDEYPASVERLSSEVRLSWNMKPGPVPNVTEVLERAGVLIIKCDFGSDKITGISMRDNELPPLIFVNHALPGDRLRFTLAHELGHLIFHHHLFLVDKNHDVEQEGHDFASAFLMPAADIRGHLLGRLTIERLAHLKALWKVSMQALVLRATRLGRITDSQKRRLFMQLGQLGFRKDEPVRIPREEPRSLVKFHLKDLGYSVDELSQLLCILPTELPKLYPGVLAPPFRVLMT